MKIADLTTYFHPQSGGIKRYLIEKAKYLSQLPYKHLLIIPGIDFKEYYLYHTKVYEIPSFLIPKTGGYRCFKNITKIKEILNLEKPDILEVGGSYFLIPLLKSKKYKLLTFYHSDLETFFYPVPLPKNIKIRLLRKLISKFLAPSDYVITPSKKMEERLKEFGLSKVTTINLGVDTETFKLRKELKNSNEFQRPWKVLYVGRLSPEKNLDFLIKIFLALPSEKFEVWIVGEGPKRKEIEKFTKKRANTKYLGYLSDELELAKLYNQADLLVSASVNETFGLTFLEAQACGCILVAKDFGLETQPFKEFLVRDLSFEAFYESIWKSSLSLSPALKLKISSYVRENFSWKETFQKLQNLYEKLLN
ncbi:MAG: glycosyltransferase [Thermodesulfobacteriaceae bacterium]|nr:glycosyltransferase [Thermodesulfobacteriaceae bacterium]